MQKSVVETLRWKVPYYTSNINAKNNVGYSQKKQICRPKSFWFTIAIMGYLKRTTTCNH